MNVGPIPILQSLGLHEFDGKLPDWSAEDSPKRLSGCTRKRIASLASRLLPSMSVKGLKDVIIRSSLNPTPGTYVAAE